MATGKKSRAEYYRDWRKMAGPQAERRAHSEGVKEGITLCVKHLREIVAGRALTGFQAAVVVERAMIDAEKPEVIARRRMIAAMQNGDAVEHESRPDPSLE